MDVPLTSLPLKGPCLPPTDGQFQLVGPEQPTFRVSASLFLPLKNLYSTIMTGEERKSPHSFAGRSDEELKKAAAWKACEYIKSDQVVGLGTGSTAAFAVERIAQLIKQGKLKNIVGIPTSIKTYEQAKSLGIPLSTLDEHPHIHVAIGKSMSMHQQLLSHPFLLSFLLSSPLTFYLPYLMPDPLYMTSLFFRRR